MAAVTTDQITGVETGKAIKVPCRVATTANITLSGTQTIDGTAVVADDRVLVWNQSSAVDNGIWVCAAGTWSRAEDFNGVRDAGAGVRIFVTEGTTYGDREFQLTTTGSITFGTTSLTFALITATTNQIADDAVTNAKLANMAQSTIKGRAAGAGTGDPTDLTGLQAGLVVSVQRAETGAAERTISSKARDVLHTNDFEEVADGGNITTALQEAIDAAPSEGAIIYLPRGNFDLTATITGKSRVWIVGAGGPHGYGDDGTMLRRQHNGIMFNFPGGATTALSGAGVGWGFENIGLDGDNRNFAIISAPEVLAGGRGSFNVSLEGVGFFRGRPAIDAENAWDWYIANCAFWSCGNMATGSGRERAVIYIYNSDQNYAGANSNCWHIVDNYIDCTTGRGIWSDSAGIGQVNQNFLIHDNHFALPGAYTNIYGAFGESMITGNTSEGVAAGRIIIDLTSATGSGRNIIAHNTLESPGTYHVQTENAQDLITGNVFVVEGSTGFYVRLGASSQNCSVIHNKTSQASGHGTIPCVSDAGTSNLYFGNDGDNTSIIRSHDAAATQGPNLVLDRASASPANSDFIGSLILRGRDAAGNATDYGQVLVQITDTTNGSEDANVIIQGIVAGTLTTRLNTSATGVDITGDLDISAGTGNVGYGSYTPTLTNTTNLDGSTANLTRYTRVGDHVHVFGQLSIDPTAAADTVLGISLPVASNIGNSYELAGTAATNSAVVESFMIYGDAANNRATLQGLAATTANHTISFQFSYPVLA